MIGFNFEILKKRNFAKNFSLEMLVINPSAKGFFNKVLKVKSKNADVKAFVESIKEVEKVNLEPFSRPIMDPSIEEGVRVVYKAGRKPAVGYSFNFWKEKLLSMPAVEGMTWSIGTEYQYYAFLVFLINKLVDKGMTTDEAICFVVIDSKRLYDYVEPKKLPHDSEVTKSGGVCGIYDLFTEKILSCSNEQVGGFWIAGGNTVPLADLCHFTYVDNKCENAVPWLVCELN